MILKASNTVRAAFPDDIYPIKTLGSSHALVHGINVTGPNGASGTVDFLDDSGATVLSLSLDGTKNHVAMNAPFTITNGLAIYMPFADIKVTVFYTPL